MSVYAVAHIDPKDPQTFDAYRARAGDALAKHGGRVAVVAPKPERLEGAVAVPATLVLLEFPDAAAARAWHGDAELADTHKLRRDGAEVTIFLMEPAA